MKKISLIAFCLISLTLTGAMKNELISPEDSARLWRQAWIKLTKKPWTPQ